MKLVLTWEEFIDAALLGVNDLHPGLKVISFPSFMSRGHYEPDHEAFNFPPDRVELEVEKRDGSQG